MLNFILGPSGSGKSYQMLAELRARAERGERSILIVPEQFTSSTEGQLYRTLGDSLSAYVESYSFTSLAEALLRRYGGAAVPTLTDAGRAQMCIRDRLYSYHGKNFVKTMIRLGQTHDKITVVNDQLGNPTNAVDLAYHILKLAVSHDYGIYHCTGNGICSWYDFASAIMQGAGLSCKVEPVTSAQYAAANPASANRPAWSALENRMLRCTVGDEMRDWQDEMCIRDRNGSTSNC